MSTVRTLARRLIRQGHTQALISREQAQAWAGRHLSDDDLGRLRGCIPHSSIPDAIGAIIGSW